jgi:hypothetical protein
MARVRLDRVRAPVDHEVGTILHFTERARDLADKLCRDLTGAMSQ